MRKLVIFLSIIFIIFPLVSAANLTLEVSNENSLIIKGTENRANFTLEITNNEKVQDDFQIYSLVGVSVFPKEFFSIPSKSTEEIEIEVLPHEETRAESRGLYSFEYEIKGQLTGLYTGRLTLDILDLVDIFDVSISEISLEDKQALITIENKKDFNFENLQIEISSEFFELSETLDLSSKESLDLKAEIKDSVKTLAAGIYEADIVFKYLTSESQSSTSINYLEKAGTSSSEETFGLIVTKDVISKANEGNLRTRVVLKESKNLLSRLFTTFSETPGKTERSGFLVNYEWQKDLDPGEEISITVTTNWTFPIILVILVLLVWWIVKRSISGPLSLQKRVSFVRSKGGEFALKIRLKAKARSDVEDIKIKDHLPRLTKLYEKFGTKPDRVDAQTRSIYWHVPRLKKGEERIFTYVIYSKINIVGRFELSAAIARFTKQGKTQEVRSNKTTFAREDVEDKEE